MNSLRVLHSADWHSDKNPVKKAKLHDSLEQMYKYCKEVKVDVLLIAGDLYDVPQTLTDNSGAPLLFEYLNKFSEVVTFVFITKGNNHHDAPGSIALLHQLRPNIYAYEYPVVLHVDSKFGVADMLREDYKYGDADFIISLVPYPTKANFINADSIDNNNADFLEKFEQIFELIGQTTAEYNCPKLLAFHGNVQGSRLSSGQSLKSQDILVAPSTIEKAEADYYALGHIHMKQDIRENMRYSGAPYNCNWGETEQKSFEVIEFEEVDMDPGYSTASHTEMTIKTIPLTVARPMIKVDMNFDGHRITEPFHAPIEVVYGNSDIRVRMTVKENDRKLLTEDVKQAYAKILSEKGNSVTFEIVIIPSERDSRSEKIMECKSLYDEVKEYAAVISYPVNGTIENKVNELQEVVL